MSIDGIAFTNLGFYRPIEPSELAQQADKASQTHAEKVIQEVENLDQIKLNPDAKQKKQQENSKEKQQENSEEKIELQEDLFEDKKYSNKYEVQYNNITNMVELIDKINQKVIETIKPEDLINIISKSKGYSGILVDRKI
jgi:uncharacterized FlaG/YvyC family protein